MASSRITRANVDRRRVLVLFVFAMLALAGSGARGAEPATPTVKLVVDYGDGAAVHFTALKWREGMTVLDALTAAQAHRHGISFTARGSGANTIITKIGDLKNEGAGKNWLYYVNEKTAETSAGIYTLKAGDAILWKFELFQYN